MATEPQTRIKFGRFSWSEELIGVALFCVVGYFVLKAINIQANINAPQNAGNNGNIPQPDSTLAYGTQYFWPGIYGGDPATSGTTGAAAATTAPGLTQLTIPDLSPVTLPPVTAPFSPTTATATASGTNDPGTGNCGCTSQAGSYAAPAVNYVAPAASSGAVKPNASPAVKATTPKLISPGLGFPSGQSVMSISIASGAANASNDASGALM